MDTEEFVDVRILIECMSDLACPVWIAGSSIQRSPLVGKLGESRLDKHGEPGAGKCASGLGLSKYFQL